MALVVGDIKGPIAMVGKRVMKIIELAYDGEYAAGGYEVSPQALGLVEIDYVDVNSSGGYVGNYDRDTGRILVEKGGAEVGDNDAGLGELTARALVFGERE